MVQPHRVGIVTATHHRAQSLITFQRNLANGLSCVTCVTCEKIAVPRLYTWKKKNALGLPPDADGNGNYAFFDAANYAAHTNDWGTTGICHRKSGIKGGIIRAKHQAGDPNVQHLKSIEWTSDCGSFRMDFGVKVRESMDDGSF